MISRGFAVLRSLAITFLLIEAAAQVGERLQPVVVDFGFACAAPDQAETPLRLAAYGIEGTCPEPSLWEHLALFKLGRQWSAQLTPQIAPQQELKGANLWRL